MSELKGFKFVTTLVLEFEKIQSGDKTLYRTFYFYSKVETIINECDIDDVFESIYGTIISKIQKFLRQDSGWIIDTVIDHKINISEYNPLAGSSFIILPKELNHPRKGLIRIKNIDDNKY